MSENSRTKNAKLNVIYWYLAQIGILILSFVRRKIFLTFLSADYLGINGLYSNILTILSLAELGLDTAVVYSLYKPVADDNKPLIASMLRFFKKVYYIVAICIFLVGLCLAPFLPFLIKSDLPSNDLAIYYILFLINTVSSYFVAYKVALFSAYQEQRIHKLVTLSANLILQLMHIIVLFIWKNYYIYIVATVVSTVVSNVILSCICNRKHNDIFKQTEKIEFDTRGIKKRVLSVFLYKIGTVLINSTDNILISVLVSTIAVGYYSNYYTVVSAITGFIAIINVSLIAGIGNKAAKGAKQEQSTLFDMMLLPYHGIAALGFIGFSLLFNNLITIWLGSEYLFDDVTVFIISFNFYITNAISPVWMFREANGLFDKVKFLVLIRAGFNILLSIVFGVLWEVFGIFLATAVSLIITNFWYEPRIISKEIFGRSQLIYWRKQFIYFLETIIAFALSYFAIKYLGNSFVMLALKAIIIVGITGGVFLICNLKSEDYKRLKNYVFRK